MKILHVIPRLSFTGGIENYVRTLCFHSSPDDYDITICTFLNKCTTEIKEELLNKGINIIPLKKSWFEKINNRLLRFFLKNSFFAYFNKLLYLKKILNDEKHNLVIAHGEDAELIVAFTPPSVKKVNVIHGESYFPANPFYRFLLFYYARKTYNFTIVINKILSTIPEKLGKQYSIVKPGIRLEQFESLQHKTVLQNGFINIGFIGRVVKEKGIFELFEAFKILKQKNRKVKLKIAGNGKALIPLQKKVKEYELVNDIEFYGEVSSPELFYKEINILVLPSLTEGLPVTILEAMASGVLVIASNVGGIPEMIKSEQNGLLLESCQPAVIASALEKLINNSALCNELVNNANETIKDFSDTRLVEEFYSVVSSLIKK